ncbi:L-threonylcarbamoyladenylate synthase [Methanohalophilus mahii]|uniref:Threonylcarbamoyl-AMP synthase n=1 Tax=Methanohalophilus mahii (strain ATCC 35705 / DSM 5219 / SLP) TaxID=547558 RepID=D5EAQ8_METMS|nr:L-threonylcarbamoyladenylate synthase [Methanohalophilus mahii]ADE36259.1 Sua5/YciO/YrdC/YwlC family protein [Methanohalophilus mahii DSM 5219]
MDQVPHMQKKTEIMRIAEETAEDIFKKAGKLLREGKTVAFPTETVYGLGADALNPQAVEQIFKAKGRPADNPLIVHVSNQEQCNQLVITFTPLAEKLAECFWPGPLTIILEKTDRVPYITTGRLETVAIRMPANQIARKIIEAACKPIAAPSANISGRPSPTTASHVEEDLQGRIDAIVDGGEVEIGVESTVVDARREVPVILRPGKISAKDIQQCTKTEVCIGYARKDNMEKPLSPGMKYTHYSPSARVILVQGKAKDVAAKIADIIGKTNDDQKKAGLLLTVEIQKEFPLEKKLSIGQGTKPREAAKRIFAGLREMDSKGMDLIIVDGSFTEKGIGAAVLERLQKAADMIITT